MKKHFQQDIFPFAKTEDENGILNASKSCAHPIPCLEGSYCLRGVTQPVVDFAGEDFTAPLYVSIGALLPSSIRNIHWRWCLPSRILLPPGISIPRPCWKGHQCRGIAECVTQSMPSWKVLLGWAIRAVFTRNLLGCRKMLIIKSLFISLSFKTKQEK